MERDEEVERVRGRSARREKGKVARGGGRR